MKNILIIEDDRLIRWSLKELFTKDNHQIDTASSAEEALFQAKKKSYQLICSDLELKEELRIDLLAKLKNMQPKAKIIILSALNRQVIEKKLGDIKVDAILEKPFTGDKIRVLANNLLKNTNRSIKTNDKEVKTAHEKAT